jgi:hypothetical protein|tara:strand:- start:210 stop:440 length:231 start_codon:yes stop_codon:yes gene_type:complete
MAKKPKNKMRQPSVSTPSMTITAAPRLMSALPPSRRIEKADVQGGEVKRTATTVTGTKRNIDGIARQGFTRARGKT